MDRETRDEYVLVIQAKDMMGQLGGLSGTTSVTVTLTDVNDNPPRFSRKLYQYSVLESVPVASVVARLKAADPDIGSNAEMDYRIVDGDGPGLFNITTDEETQEGVIILQRALIFESVSDPTLLLLYRSSVEKTQKKAVFTVTVERRADWILVFWRRNSLLCQNQSPRKWPHFG
ncbi:hypothetical protein SRHO_G00275850 [Serrasalmus rhombeus]